MSGRGTDSDWPTWDFPELQALPLLVRKSLVSIAPYLGRFHRGRGFRMRQVRPLTLGGYFETSSNTLAGKHDWL